VRTLVLKNAAVNSNFTRNQHGNANAKRTKEGKDILKEYSKILRTIEEGIIFLGDRTFTDPSNDDLPKNNTCFLAKVVL